MIYNQTLGLTTMIAILTCNLTLGSTKASSVASRSSPFLVHLIVGAGSAGGGLHLNVTPPPVSTVVDMGCRPKFFLMSGREWIN